MSTTKPVAGFQQHLRFYTSVLALVLMPILLIGCSDSPSVGTEWRLAFKAPIDSPDGMIFQDFAARVFDYTQGEISITLFPSEQLGKAQATLEQLSAGVIDIYADEVSYLEKWSPDISWTSAPFLFEDRAHLLRFLASDYHQSLVDTATDAANVTVLGKVGAVLRGPYRVLLSTKSVTSIDDIEGLKLRIWDNDLVVAVWTALGAEVRVLGWSDVYQSIQTGIVDAVTSPASSIEPMKFTEIAHYVARTDEFSQAVAFLINADSLGALSEANRVAVLRAYYETGEFSQELITTLTAESVARLKGKGATFVDLNTKPFVQRASLFYAEKASTGALPKAFLIAVEQTR